MRPIRLGRGGLCAGALAVAVALAVALAMALTGCSAGSPPAPEPKTTAAAVNGCANAGADWRAVHEGNVDAAELGSGPAVVFGNDSGNSVCDWLVIEAAAGHPAELAAIVSLSGERVIGSHPDILDQARQVTVPALYIGAREDPNTDGSSQQTQLHRAMGGRPNELIQLDGFDHGTELIDDPAPAGGSVGSHIINFLQAQLQP